MSSNIEPLGLQLGAEVTPTGTVSFTAQQGTGPIIPLGVGTVPACLAAVVVTITPCTAAIIRYPQLTAGTWTIHANYSGDKLMANSTTTATLTVVAVPSDDQQFCSAAYLSANDDYCTLYSSSPDGTTNASIQQNTAVDTTLTLFWGGPPLSCSPEGPPGDIVNFGSSDTNTNDGKTISYTIYGAAATTLNNDYPTDDGGYEDQVPPICFGSLNPFTTLSGSPAPFVNGEYEGILPYCGYNDFEVPCLGGTYYYPGGEGDPSYTYYVDTDGGDPRVGGS